MIDFEPTEEQRMMREAVGQLARTALASRVREIERARALPPELRRAAHEMGLGGIALPASSGGQELGLVTRVLLEEEIARVDPAAAFAMPGPGAFGDALVELADAATRDALLAPFFESEAHDRHGAVAWSEPRPHAERPGLCTVAERSGHGWVLRGHKAYVHNAALADRFVVVAQVEPERGWEGLGAFVVMADAAGLKVGARHDTLGLDAAWFGALELDGARALCRLEPEGPLHAALVRFFSRHALAVAARAVGLAHSAFELARAYCDERVAFGKPIGHFQAVAFTLADRLMDVESARWMVWRAAWAYDAGKPERQWLRDGAQAVAHALEVAMRSADDCVSLHGGMGFMRDLPAEKMMRDAKQLALCCPTAEQLDQLAALLELGAPIDPALVLPTPEAQPIFV